MRGRRSFIHFEVFSYIWETAPSLGLQTILGNEAPMFFEFLDSDSRFALQENKTNLTPQLLCRMRKESILTLHTAESQTKTWILKSSEEKVKKFLKHSHSGAPSLADFHIVLK